MRLAVRHEVRLYRDRAALEADAAEVVHRDVPSRHQALRLAAYALGGVEGPSTSGRAWGAVRMLAVDGSWSRVLVAEEGV